MQPGPPQPPAMQPPQRPEHPALGGGVRWAASPPPGADPPPSPPAERPYTGPPSYPAPPRWGFPNLTWRWPTSVPGTASARLRPAEALRPVGTWLVGVLVAMAAFAVLAGAAELWRYALVVQSRDAPLTSGTVGVSDGLVLAFWLPVPILWFGVLALGLWWLQLARTEAAERAEVAPPRSTAAAALRVGGLWLVIGVATIVVHSVQLPPLVVVIGAPVAVLVVVFAAAVLSGPVVAELEHLTLRRPAEQRPRPSRLVLAWWAAWVVNAALAVLTLWRGLDDGVQAQADVIVLTAATHGAAAAAAMLTALVVRRISLLLAPAVPGRLRELQVISVRGAAAPPLRTVRPGGGRR